MKIGNCQSKTVTMLVPIMSQEQRKTFNLFVYGTLTNPWVFRAVLGKQLVTKRTQADGLGVLHARRAVLNGYKKISPDNTYLYAVPEAHSRIIGYLIESLRAGDMEALKRYEGRNYRRKKLRVQTATGPEAAVVFLGKIEQLEHSFGYEFRDPFKQEVLLDHKIDQALIETERKQLHTTEKVTRRAVAELHGATIRDLVRRHFDAGGISDYAIKRSLQDRPLRDFSRIIKDPKALTLAPNYLAMVVRQVIFNQFEERIRREFRYELDHMQLAADYYDRTVTSLAALRILNEAGPMINILVGDCLAEIDFTASRLIDYVRWAVATSDAIYDEKNAKQHLNFIRNHTGGGYIPMGAELEFSNVGHRVISDPQCETVCDGKYDGFVFFRDFALDILTWKLGGHIDDHHVKSSDKPRRGFFEVALGNLSIEANISKPLTNDPWIMNQFIRETQQFYDIAPHSLHISLQLRRQHSPIIDRLPSIGVFKCLFALAGAPDVGGDGNIHINRLVREEIIVKDLPHAHADQNAPHMLFSEISRRHSSENDPSHHIVLPSERGRYVQQFKFLRLSPKINYEPIAMALKGIQISLRPGNFLTAAQHESSRKHRRLFEKLVEWGKNPTALGSDDIEAFLGPVYDGLMKERRGKPAHTPAYIAWSINRIRSMLDKFNELLK